MNCDPDETWYPAGNFKNAAGKLEDFHTTYPRAAGPPVRLGKWLRAAADNTWADDHNDDGKAEHDDLDRKRRTRRHVSGVQTRGHQDDRGLEGGSVTGKDAGRAQTHSRRHP